MVVHRHYSDCNGRSASGARGRSTARLTQRDMDLAFGVQRVFEDILHVTAERAASSWCPIRAVSRWPAAARSTAWPTAKLFDQTPFRETCIQPAAGDDGLALGAALYVSNAC